MVLNSGVFLSTSDVITLASIAVTIGTSLWAFRERKTAAHARSEAKKFRRLLLQQQLSQEFSDVPKLAQDLVRQIRSRQLTDGVESALVIAAKLSSLNGVRDDLIDGDSRSLVKEASEMMGGLNKLITSVDEEDREALAAILQGCNAMVVYTSSIESSLRRRVALGGDPDDRS